MGKPNKYMQMLEPAEAETAPDGGEKPLTHLRTGPRTGEIRAMPVTEARIQTFLAEMRRHGIFARAARAASPHSKHGCMMTWKDLRAEDPEFRAAIEEAKEMAIADMEHELHRRAVEGYEDPVFQRGEQVGTIRRYSDRLLELMVKAHDPKYREKAQVEHAHAGVFAVTQLSELAPKLSKESRDDLRKIILRESKDNDHPEEDGSAS